MTRENHGSRSSWFCIVFKDQLPYCSEVTLVYRILFILSTSFLHVFLSYCVVFRHFSEHLKWDSLPSFDYLGHLRTFPILFRRQMIQFYERLNKTFVFSFFLFFCKKQSPSRCKPKGGLSSYAVSFRPASHPLLVARLTMISEAIAAVHRLIAARLERNLGLLAAVGADPVSYTHLTLPTIA